MGKSRKNKRLDKSIPIDIWRNLMPPYKTFSDIRIALKDAIQREQALGHKLEVIIGTDSQVYGKIIFYGTVIVILRERRGGFMFIKNQQRPAWFPGAKKKMSVKERLLIETQMSIETAFEISSTLEELGVEPVVHADINTKPNFASNAALKETIGYAMGMGLKVEAKPEAWGATYAADKVV